MPIEHHLPILERKRKLILRLKKVLRAQEKLKRTIYVQSQINITKQRISAAVNDLAHYHNAVFAGFHPLLIYISYLS
jgi:hypothetical protein